MSEKSLKIELSYDEREYVIGALTTYERYLRTGKAICTYGTSPKTAKAVARLDKKIRKVHFPPTAKKEGVNE